MLLMTTDFMGLHLGVPVLIPSVDLDILHSEYLFSHLCSLLEAIFLKNCVLFSSFFFILDYCLIYGICKQN